MSRAICYRVKVRLDPLMFIFGSFGGDSNCVNDLYINHTKVEGSKTNRVLIPTKSRHNNHPSS